MSDSLTVTIMMFSALCLAGILLIAACVMVFLMSRRRGWRQSFKGALWLGVVPLLAPAAFLVIAGAMASIAAPMLMETTSGVVVSNVEITDAAGDPVYVAEVEFSTRTGEQVRFQDPLAGSNPPQYTPGQAVTVAYSPEAPKSAIIFDPSILIMPLVLVLLAALAWPIGAVIGWYKFRGARSPN